MVQTSSILDDYNDLRKNNRNYALDLLKGIGSIGVVFMHIVFPGIVGGVMHKIAEFAVPIFAMISGYYAYDCSDETIKRRLTRLIKIFIISFALYTIFHAFVIGWDSFCVYLSLKWLLVKAIVFCTVDYAIPLWYLIAMIETYLVWLWLKNYQTIIRYIGPIIVILFILSILSRIVFETMHMPWYLKVNFVTCALPWFLTGYFFIARRIDLTY